MGSITPYKIKRVSNFLENKLEIVFENGKERKGWYWQDGKKILRVTIPHQHGGGSGDSLSARVFNDLKNNLKVTRDEFLDLYNCPMSLRDYQNKLEKSGYI